MASPDIEPPWICAAGESFCGSFNIRVEEGNAADFLHVLEVPTSSVPYNCSIPEWAGIQDLRNEDHRKTRRVQFRSVTLEVIKGIQEIFFPQFRLHLPTWTCTSSCSAISIGCLHYSLLHKLIVHIMLCTPQFGTKEC